MASKSLTLSEELADKYRLNTRGTDTPKYGCVISRLALIAAPSREALKALSKVITANVQPRLFGCDDFSFGALRAQFYAVPGLSGWKRYPGADHWIVTRDGREIFRTQNYNLVLRYFLRAANLA